MSHLNDSNNSKYNFTVLANLDSFSHEDIRENKHDHAPDSSKIQDKKIQDNTGNHLKEQSRKISHQLTPARYTLHRFGVEVTQFGIGDGLGWDLTSVYRDNGLNAVSYTHLRAHET